ncbi:MAG: hypothetical protein U0325_12375 [Polyangiales bacterium]
MNARAWVLSASLLLGCLPAAEPYRCDLAGGDRACDSVPGAQCVSGYCAERVAISLCPSGLRYTATARRPGACVAVDDDVPTDVIDAVADLAPLDLPGATDLAMTDDLVAADRPTPLDAPDVAIGPDAPDAGESVDAVDVAASPDARDVGGIFDAPDAPDARDVLDAGATSDAVDAGALRDAADAGDPQDAAALRDVTDAPDAFVPPVDWIAPLPNERFLSGRIRVRIARRGAGTVSVRTALGIACNGAQTVTPIVDTQVDVATSRNYLCLRIEVDDVGERWISPWRHVVSMGRSYDPNAVIHWGRWPDFNNDGSADLLMASATSVTVQHFSTSGAIMSGAVIQAPSLTARPVALAAVGDVDGDSFGDAIISWDLVPGREVYLYRGGASGLRGPVLRLAAPGAGPNADTTFGDRIFPIGDRGSEGRSDFGVSANRGNFVRTFGLSAQGALQEGPSYVAGAPIDAFVSDADVDADGQPDSAFHTGSATYLSLSSMRDNILVPREVDSSGDFGRVLAFGSDLDNDGRSELAVLAPDTAQAVVYRWASNALTVIARVDLRTPGTVAIVMPGDASGDMADDLFVFSGANQVRLRRGGYTNDVDGVFAWRGPLGVILAGAAENDTRGRVWGGGTVGLAPNGFAIYGYDGVNVTASAYSVPGGMVTAVAP